MSRARKKLTAESISDDDNEQNFSLDATNYFVTSINRIEPWYAINKPKLFSFSLRRENEDHVGDTLAADNDMIFVYDFETALIF